MPKIGRFSVQNVPVEDEIITNIILQSGHEFNIHQNTDIKFKLINKIGQGAQGSVWMSKLMTVDKNIKLFNDNKKTDIFSIKFIKMPKIGTHEQISLDKEIKNLIRLGKNSDFVVKTYNFYKQNGYILLIMEYINGFTLNNIINRILGFKKEKRIIFMTKILEQLIFGLKYIHDKNIIHRDIKPSNIMVDIDNIYCNIDGVEVSKIKYIDFGISCGKYEINECVYADGSLGRAGTSLYLSYELLPRNKYDNIHKSDAQNIKFAKRVDIFSLGVTFFELFHTYTPFENPDLMKNLYKSELFFLLERHKFKPIKSKMKYHYYKEYEFFDFIINVMIENHPDMRFDIKKLYSIFTGKYKYIESIPNIELLNKINNLKLDLNKHKRVCKTKCPNKTLYLREKKASKKKIKCQDMKIFNLIPLSCKYVCTKVPSWKMNKCDEYIPSIDHQLMYNKLSKEELIEWLNDVYEQHTESNKMAKKSYKGYYNPDLIK